MAERGLPVEGAVVSPALSIKPLGPVVELPAGVAAIFTSRHGVGRVSAPAGSLAFCVGDATADAAKAQGFDAVSAEGTVEDLLTRLAGVPPETPLAYFRGTHTRTDLARRLKDLGRDVVEHVVYDQPAQSPSAEAKALLAGDQPVVVPLFSPRTASIVLGWAGNARAPLQAVALSDAVAEAWGRDAMVADRPDMDAMLDAVARVYASQGNG